MTSRTWLPLASLALLTAGLASRPTPAPKPEAKIEFNRDIRPILGKCSSCHGPSTGDGFAGLRLDTFERATKTLPNGERAIVPGHPEQSELVRRIRLDGPGQMPPPDSHKTLSDDEKQALEDWIKQGAEFKEHWGWVKPVKAPLPLVKDTKWPRNEIDRFVLARLEGAGLHPSPEADKATLLRRVALDLTGLPPTPEELAAFLRDKSPNAYEKQVDRLLASPRYGERMAMDWMDYARYADSNGYQADYERYQYRWRDWVIAAFNKNMPYDEFTIEQLAGDLLPNATFDQKLATGFNRNHRINTEGGVIAEEWRVENVIDRVETTSETWLGLTAGCARCHDHKYDPISQKEFYSLFAYFNNVPESGTGEERPVNHPPLMRAPYPEQRTELARLMALVQKQQAVVDQRIAGSVEQAASWKGAAHPPAPVRESLVARYVLGAHSKVAAGQAPEPKSEGPVADDLGRSTGAVVTKPDAYLDLGQVGEFDSKDAFSYGAWIYPEDGNGAAIARMDSPNDFRGWDLFFAAGQPMVHLIDKWPDDALKVTSKTKIPLKQWSHVFVTVDGSRKPDGVKIYIDGKPVEKEVERDALKGTIRTTVPLTVGRRTGANMFSGRVDDLAIYSRALKPEEVARLADVRPAARLLAIPAKDRTPEQQKLVARAWLEETDPAFRKQVAELATSEERRKKVDSEITTVMVMEEMPTPRDCFVLIRGQYDQHGDKVTASVPAFLPPLPKGAPDNRLGLAEWIVSKDNPLTARVAVNRMWARCFGTGIVETSEDFGTRASFPTHPELLDTLAVDFMESGWDLKAMWKKIVTSAAYRQSSAVTPELLEADPKNLLVSRGPRHRLPGEVLRDQALFVSGLLVEKLGGPSVRPYQPKGIWDETNVYGNLRNYMPDKGDGLYRRSLYTIWKRTAAPPNMLLFDVPSRETCRVRRAITDTPLQALAMMNDPTYVEASRVLAQRVMKLGSTPRERLAKAFELALCRPPTDKELSILESGFAKRLAKYRADPAAAKELLAEGDAPIDPSVEPAVLAAYTIATSTILNLDETVTKE
ncbi:MAG: DUF1553 domain-containing protein [Fimbriimonadaceae bacterium]|nr:DUF1553 domain-containing protein [Chthonomonadaceae bacterium]MCO5297226.1 DUF1553 domain-containing protein [Fimbriimonadaceae bacterium]